MFRRRSNSIKYIKEKQHQKTLQQIQDWQLVQQNSNRTDPFSCEEWEEGRDSLSTSSNQTDSSPQLDSREVNTTFISGPAETASVEELIGYLLEQPYESKLYEECSECRGRFQGGQSGVVQLGCRHHFHKECAQKWLRREGFLQAFYAVCPKCKYSVFQMQRLYD
eukprot:TRINITY_DN1666_c0_g1_i7.p2 TRINITY_DN1666_c0_g1~~TRINITY_DN1666_c0_g1_i7.p2  ORF type:complete len:165 (-),score=11.73 TRINITY_DN1666_c0_g1_i7:252-746(-)